MLARCFPIRRTICAIVAATLAMGCDQEPPAPESPAGAHTPPVAVEAVDPPSAVTPSQTPVVKDGYATPRDALTAFDRAVAGRQWTHVWWSILPGRRTATLAHALDTASEAALRNRELDPDARASLKDLLETHDLPMGDEPAKEPPSKALGDKPVERPDALFEGVMGWMARHLADGADPRPDVRIVELKVEGESATGTLYLNGEVEQTLSLMQNEEERWFIAPSDSLMKFIGSRLNWRP